MAYISPFEYEYISYMNRDVPHEIIITFSLSNQANNE